MKCVFLALFGRFILRMGNYGALGKGCYGIKAVSSLFFGYEGATFYLREVFSDKCFPALLLPDRIGGI